MKLDKEQTHYLIASLLAAFAAGIIATWITWSAFDVRINKIQKTVIVNQVQDTPWIITSVIPNPTFYISDVRKVEARRIHHDQNQCAVIKDPESQLHLGDTIRMPLQPSNDCE